MEQCLLGLLGLLALLALLCLFALFGLSISAAVLSVSTDGLTERGQEVGHSIAPFNI